MAGVGVGASGRWQLGLGVLAQVRRVVVVLVQVCRDQAARGRQALGEGMWLVGACICV